ncbi:MAG: RDD family protein [Bacteroidia bacterium]|nr:RDD family protein [Bacteroidia bacterium]
MFYIKIRTTQNVYIKYSLSGLGQRIPAAIIDFLIVFAYWYLLYVIFFDVLYHKYDYFRNIEHDLKEYERVRKYNENLTIVFILITFPCYIYHFLCESFMDGQSFGKKMMNIKVVKLDGTQPDFYAIAIRSAMRLIDVYFMGGIVAVFSIISGKKGQRLGDISAGTTVISLSDRVTLDMISWEEKNDPKEKKPLFENITLLTDDDIDLIDKALKNREVLGSEYLMKLSKKIKEKISYREKIKDPVAFLSKVLESYKKVEFNEEIL